MTTVRASLTFGHDLPTTRIIAAVHPSPSVSPYGGVELDEDLTVTAMDPVALLEIAAAFTKAADELTALLADATAFGREVAAAWADNESPSTTREHVGREAHAQAVHADMPRWFAEHAQRVAAAAFTPLAVSA